MIRVTDLKPGDEIQGWMRLGYALFKTRKIDGGFRMCTPTRAQTAKSGDLSTFLGLVTANDVLNKQVTLEVQEKNQNSRPVGDSFTVIVPYRYLRRLTLFSKINYFPKPNTKPGYQPFGWAPYRTQEEVLLVWS